MATYVVGVTGASGAPYALRLLEALIAADHHVKLVVSDAGEKVLAIECGLHLQGASHHKEALWRERLGMGPQDQALQLFLPTNLAASIASGSFRTAGMVVIPCSMGTLARIAQGISGNLIERAADVHLKERRPLVLVPRETPLNEIHLRNMLAARRAGADIVPAMPAFYHKPQSIQELVEMLVSRVLDRLGVENDLYRRWGEPAALDALTE
jgi:4-hydroxy-3-polyprenylbenzoate decarboxylase